jgi:hypothetical chaperone protein
MGIDFGTTNSVVALAQDASHAQLVPLAAPEGTQSVFRSALCFWQDERSLAHEAGPWAIAEFLDFPQGSRFLQSFKSVVASPSFEHANLFEKRLPFEELGQIFLRHLLARGGAALKSLPEKVIVGRPVRYVGNRPDEALARKRYDAMFGMLGREVHYVYEPLGAAYSFASRLSKAATLLVADFGGGTSDFSIVRVEAPGAAKRCTPWAARASASRATVSTIASWTSSCCRCWARAAPIAPSTRCSTFPRAISLISATGRAWP